MNLLDGIKTELSYLGYKSLVDGKKLKHAVGYCGLLISRLARIIYPQQLDMIVNRIPLIGINEEEL
jgi:hypothetical protein